MNSLEVLLGDLRVGLLERFDDPYDTHRFTPDRQWLAMRARPVLGQIFEDWLPHPKELHGLIPWFDHLLPLEHRPQRKAIARDAGVEVDDSFALLAWLGDDLVGAVRLRVVESSPLQNRRTSRTIKAATEEAIYRASLPGAQWKLSLAEGFNGLTLPLKGQAGEWIAKFHTDSFPAAVRREYATMAWARAAGLDFVINPVVGGAITDENAALQGAAIAGARGKVLAYCASGNRSSIVWAMSQAGRRPTDELIAAAARHGYNLEPFRARIDALAPA
jgi:HipA-like protein